MLLWEIYSIPWVQDFQWTYWRAVWQTIVGRDTHRYSLSGSRTIISLTSMYSYHIQGDHSFIFEEFKKNSRRIQEQNFFFYKFQEHTDPILHYCIMFQTSPQAHIKDFTIFKYSLASFFYLFMLFIMKLLKIKKSRTSRWKRIVFQKKFKSQWNSRII